VSRRPGSTHVAVLTGVLAAALLMFGLPLTTGSVQQSPMRDNHPTWSPRGEIAYAHAERLDEWVMIRSRNGATRRLAKSPDQCCMDALAYSPDGRTLAMIVNFRLFLIDVASGRIRRVGPADQFDWAPHSRSLVVKPVYEPLQQMRIVRRSDLRTVRWLPRGSSPQWSPNGRLIAYAGITSTTLRTELYGLYVISAGGGKPRLLQHVGHSTGWSPDSRQVLFARWVGGIPGSWLIPVRGGTARRIVRDAGKAEWSPTARHIAFWDAGPTIEIVTATGKPVRRVTGDQPSWSRDGLTIAFSSSRSCSHSGIWRYSLGAWRPVRLTGAC
jgi:Tol biopolymer transport system component